MNNLTKVKETKIKLLFATAKLLYPNAGCELNFNNVYELSIAVILSAQTTDVSVNKVTPRLFSAYPDFYSLSEANLSNLEELIKTIGLYHTKSKHLILLAKQVVEKFDGKLPENFELLQTLPGIGRKTANVILSVGFNLPGLAVDTHVLRVSQRFGFVPKGASPLSAELILKKALPESQWSEAHHAILFFGRYLCTARNPKCDICPLSEVCRYKKMND